MKKILNKCLFPLAALVLFAACKKDAVLTYLDVVPFPANLTASATDVSLSAGNNDSSVITFSWPAVTFKVQAPVTYTLQLDVPADTIGTTGWSNAQSMEIGADVLLKSFTGADLNTLALSKLGLIPDSANTVVVRVVATLDRNVYSNAVEFTVKPYKAVVKNVLYVPGQYQNWDPPTAPVIAEATGHPKMYEGYYYMPGSGTLYFKFTNAPDWNHINYGDGGNGTFNTDGAAGALRNAANVIGNLKNTHLSDFFRKILYKTDRVTAISATARKLAVIIWNMITKKEPYKPPTEYLLLDQKRKLKLVKQVRKTISKRNLKPQDVGFLTT